MPGRVSLSSSVYTPCEAWMAASKGAGAVIILQVRKRMTPVRFETEYKPAIQNRDVLSSYEALNNGARLR